MSRMFKDRLLNLENGFWQLNFGLKSTSTYLLQNDPKIYWTKG